MVWNVTCSTRPAKDISAIEIKSGATIASDYFSSLNRVAKRIPHVISKCVVYGGIERQSRTNGDVVPLGDFAGVLERIEVEQAVGGYVEEK